MKLLFNYLPYSMKDSDPVVRSNKKANSKGTPTNGNGSNTKITKFFNSFYSSSNSNNNNNDDHTNTSNGTPMKTLNSTGSDGKVAVRKRGRPRKQDAIAKTMTNGTKVKKSSPTPNKSSAASTSLTTSAHSAAATNGNSTPKKRRSTNLRATVKRKDNNKSSPKLRPRRRASQTYFFKYQLARNPLKAEEEDLKLALLASLQQCGGRLSKQQQQQLQLQQQLQQPQQQPQPQQGSQQRELAENTNHNHKQPKKENHSNHQLPNKQQKQKHLPPKQPSHLETVTTIQQPTPPIYDEEYLKRYRPETEDFLTFICFRVTAPIYPSSKQNDLSGPTASGSLDHISNHNSNNNNIDDGPLNGCVTTSTGINIRISNDKTSNDYHNLRRSTSPCKSSASNQTASNSSPNPLNSPSNRRRPTRQSPRLASSSRKISEFDSLNNYTAYDNQITYEEDMKRAQIALEDMAHEINGSDDSAQSCPRSQQISSSKNGVDGGCTSPSGKLLSPYKNNKHLVKGLMTREFAGAFADEEIIFESIKNHKLQ